MCGCLEQRTRNQFLLCEDTEEAEDTNFDHEVTERKIFPSARQCQAPDQHSHKRDHCRIWMDNCCMVLALCHQTLCEVVNMWKMNVKYLET